MRIRASVLLVALWAAPAAAQVDAQAGTSAFGFLGLPQNARLVAMGGAGVAEASDQAALQINPAGLSQQRLQRWSATYSELFSGVQSGMVSYSRAVESETVIGLALTYLSSTNIPGRDATNQDLGTWGFSDLAFSASVGTRVMGGPDTLSPDMRRRLHMQEFRLDAGLTVKGIYEKLYTYTASGVAADLGVLAHLPDDRTRIGVSALNLGTQTSAYLDEKDPLPSVIVAGLRHALRGLPLLVAGDARFPRDNKVRFGAGLEALLFAQRNRPAPLAVRVGYNSQGRDLRTAAESSETAGFSTGLGVRWKALELDYSFTPGLGLGTLQQVYAVRADRGRVRQFIGLALLGGILLSACHLSSTEPRQAVIKFLGAVKVADTLAILQGFTLEAPYTILPDTGLWPDGDPRNDTLMAARLLAELSPGGSIHQRWLERRMVVGEAEVRGDSAKVEVTSLEQIQGMQVYNKFGVVRWHGYWRIYSFGTETGPGL